MAQARRGLFGGSRLPALQNDPMSLEQMLGFGGQMQPAGLAGLLAPPSVVSTGAKPIGQPMQGGGVGSAAPSGESWLSRLRTGIRDMGRAYNGLPTSQDEQFGTEFAGLLGATDPKMREAAYGQMQQALARRAATGGDIAPYAQMATDFRTRGMVDDAARTLPGQLQAYGRIAPSAGASFAFDQSSNDLYGGPDGAYFRATKGAGPMERLQGPQPGFDWMPPDETGATRPRAGGAADPAYQQKLQYGRTLGQVEATPPDPVDPLGESEVVAQVLQRARQVGYEGLSDAERRIFDYQTTRPEPGGMDALVATLLGGGMGAATGAQPPAPQPRGQRPAARGGIARPQTDADFAALPSGAQFIDPDNGRLYVKP